MPPFTAEAVLRAARNEAPEFRSADPALAIDREVLADLFNDELSDLLQEIAEADPESLETVYSVPASVVNAGDPDIDLTDDGTGAGAYEWLFIDYIDLTNAEGVVDEVYVVTVADRAAEEQYEDETAAGYLTDQMRKLRKIGEWGDWGLEIHGILQPPEVDPDAIETTAFDYARPVRSALKWQLVLRLAAHVGLRDPRMLGLWQQRAAAAREQLGLIANRPIGSRVERVATTNRSGA